MEDILSPDNAGASPAECVACALAQYTVYSPTLSADPIGLANVRKETRKYGSQKTILREGEVPDSISTLKSGWAFRFGRLPNGRRQIYSFLIPGDIVTPESLWRTPYPLPFSIKALNRVELCSFNRRAFRAALSTSESQEQRLARMAQGYFGNIYRRFADLGRRSAGGRLAQLILEFERRLRHRGLTRGRTFDFPLRQDHLADALGLAPEYTSRTLMTFRKEGLIQLERQQLTILNIEALREIAEDE